MGKHSAERRSPLPALLSVVAVLAIAGAAFLVYRVLSGSNSQAAPLPAASSSASSSSSSASSTPSTTTSSSPTTTTSPAASPTTSAADAAATKALQECVTRQNAAKPVVDATNAGVKDWSAHLQGQTDIDSGAKTYIDVKTNVFGPTRAAGPGEVTAFDSAMTSYSGVGGCQNVAGLQASADLESKLKACAAREQAIDTYMDKAKAVMTDWRVHLQEMADHSDGHLNGPDAQARWIERYKAAGTNLNPYVVANAALASAPACTA